MNVSPALVLVLFLVFCAPPLHASEPPLGLPPVPIPADNPQTPENIALGQRLFEDKRFSADGTVSCATCHDREKAFGDALPVSEGVGKQKGTRNAPTVVNAAFYKVQFWDGRRSSLEEQARDPFVNPVEHGLKSHQPILDVIRGDPDYPAAFGAVFGVDPASITIDHVVKAIASFERTLVSGNSPFDRYLYGDEKDAMSAAAIRGLGIFRDKGRCQSCHTIEQTDALFTNNQLHNLGVGFKRIEPRLMEIANALRSAVTRGETIDEKVLTAPDISELGHYVVTFRPSDIGRFKTSGLRNIAVTGPYMHDGSLKTLEEVVELYNKGGEPNPMLDSGILPLDLTAEEKADLVAFLNALTSPEFAHLQTAK